MNPLSDGIVTFLLTDLEQSAALWEQSRAQMRAALARHDAIAQECIAQAGGTLVKPRGEGDSLFITFARPSDALSAALALQRALLAEAWDTPAPLRVRMALHTGEVDMRDGDYYGLTVNRCARIRNVAHGGQILLSQTVADLTRDHLPEGASLLDMGAHGLKDLQRPERLWQMQHPDLPADFPPLRSLEVYRHNLPRQLTSFIGREEELAEIKRLLAQTCLLTLLGSGGCGKTRLALQAAADLVDAYPDGVWFVELAPLADPALIAPAIAKTAGVREQAGRDALETLCEALHTQTTLLILDNCEHLAEAAAKVVRQLLQSCPRLCILATSRVRLNVPGETAWRVPSLLVPDADPQTSPEEALRNASLRLFVERATSAHSAFALTALNLPAVGQICRRLDGIPLAIELAAARLNTLTAQKVAQRLDKRFKLLVGGGATVLERHQTLQALIDWSHDLLSTQERILLRRLAVFAGGWTLEACEAVCGWGKIDADDVLDLLTRLVDASLVIAEEQGEAHRYHLLETVRQYGQERLEEAEEDASARDRHLDYFTELAEEAEPQLIQATQAEWLARLETEHDNLRAALTWAVGGETRLRLASALWRFWQLRYISEGRGWLEGAVASGRGLSDALRAKALNALGVLAMRQCDYETASTRLNECLLLRQEIGDEGGTAEALNNLGSVAGEQGNYTLAQSLYEQSLAIQQRVRDKWGEAACLNNLGMTLCSLDNYPEAKLFFERSLRIYRQMQDVTRIASVSANLGMIALHAQDYKTAVLIFEEILIIFRASNNKSNIAITCYNLGQAMQPLGSVERARLLFSESLDLCHEINDCTGVAYALAGLARVAAEEADYERATQFFGAAAHLRRMYQCPLSDADQEDLNRETALVQAHMSEQEFTAAWQTTETLTYQEVVAFAAARRGL